MNSIIQWNCNGCIFHNGELKLLLSEIDPICVALQETHFKLNHPYSFRGYNIFRKDINHVIRAKGGVALLIRKDIPHSPLVLNTVLQAVAVRILAPININICSLYLPDANWRKEELEDLISQLPIPFLLVGDMNAHNPLWGSLRRDIRGSILEQLLDRDNLILLNSGAMTYFNARSRDFSAIDLSLASPRIATRLSWRVLDDSYNSDHFPIVISTDIPETQVVPPPKWLVEKAQWSVFEEHLDLPGESDDIYQEVENLTACIKLAAEKAIPMRTQLPTRRLVPWWNPQVRDAIQKKKRAFNRFRRYNSLENLILFKKARAEARRLLCRVNEHPGIYMCHQYHHTRQFRKSGAKSKL
ncbi:hypothetical protein JTB14_005307 [Gonioctena quinquepunctata]|nr:hypothetical protein JTB14_005307 [Gonioctena quinquepunctata]